MDEKELSKNQKAQFRKILSEFKSEVMSELNSIKTEINAIKKFKTDFIDDEVGLSTKVAQLLSDVERKKKEAELKLDEVYNYYNEAFNTDDDEDIESIPDKISKLVIEAENGVKDITYKQKELSTFHDKVFGKEEEGKIVKDGYKQQYENKIELISKFQKEQDTKFKALFDQIEGLLPGATSIGLASALEKQKDSYTDPIKIWSRVFAGTMIVMTIFSLLFYLDVTKSAKTVNDVLFALLTKLPFFVPTVWLAIFASKQQSQAKRLQQEYAYKESFAKVFDGHKKQIEALDISDKLQNEMLVTLMQNIIKVLSENPSSTLDNASHIEKPPFISLWDRIFPQRKEKNEQHNPNSSA